MKVPAFVEMRDRGRIKARRLQAKTVCKNPHRCNPCGTDERHHVLPSERRVTIPKLLMRVRYTELSPTRFKDFWRA